jgi:pyruvate,water dikinase
MGMYDDLDLNDMDRSISGMRTLRIPDDEDIFWFRDDLHQPYPISPLGMTTVQKHHAWGYHVAAEETQLPPSKGGHVKIFKGRVLLGFEELKDGAEIGRRAVEFGKLLDYLRGHWHQYYTLLIEEVKQGLNFMGSVNDGMSDADLSYAIRRSEEINKRNWEIHFTLMYPADALYFEFEAFCKEHGIEEKDATIMLKGLDTMATRTDQGLWELAKLADEVGIGELFLKEESKDLLKKLNEDPHATRWLTSFHQFLDIYGHRITAAHLDVLFPTWIEDPTPVLETIKTYIPRVRQGWDIREEREKMIKESQEASNHFLSKLPSEKQEKFKKLLDVGQKTYQFQEDHGFYIDGSSTARLHDVAMVCGRRLKQGGLLEQPEDVFFLNYNELEEVMAGLSRNRNAAIYHYRRMIPCTVKERKWGWNQVKELQEAPLTLGMVPEKVTDPIMIKVFGMIDEVIKAGKVEELKVMDRFEGYPGAPGMIEGPARVITSFEDFPKLQHGEILVCPYTATAWTPLFPKIKGVVTDTGGMLTHAAITAREYRVPAVVGTWRATKSIQDGDLIRVDGNLGIVEIIKRVKS